MAPPLRPLGQLRMLVVCSLQLLMSSWHTDGLRTRINIKRCGLAGRRKYHPVNGLSLSLVSISALSCVTGLFQTRPLSASQGTELQHYHCWQGIKYIWAAGGPLDSGCFPENVSASPEGLQALRVRQHIDTFKSTIIDCLDTLPVAQQTA